MTDTEQTTEDVTEQVAEKAVKKASKKKTAKKAAEPIAEKVTEQVTEQASKEEKRARLVNKLTAMGMLPGSKGVAASSSGEVARTSLALPAWLSPQLLVLVAGAAVFTLLIWSLDQEKQLKPQQVAYSIPAYNPYAMTPPVLPYPSQAVPATQRQKKTVPAPQATAQVAPDKSAYPAQAYYPDPYYYGYHPAMQFGFNGYMPGNGAPYYYGYPQRPPAYGYTPYGRGGRGYAYPPPAPQAGQR